MMFSFRLKDDQLLFTLDLEVQLLLKQGQVEVDAGQFIHDYNNSVLIHRSVVEDLNATIKVVYIGVERQIMDIQYIKYPPRKEERKNKILRVNHLSLRLTT